MNREVEAFDAVTIYHEKEKTTYV